MPSHIHRKGAEARGQSDERHLRQLRKRRPQPSPAASSCAPGVGVDGILGSHHPYRTYLARGHRQGLARSAGGGRGGTETSVESEWVLEEAEAGKQRRCLVPVSLDPVAPPLGFGSIQAANLVGWASDRSSPVYQSLATDIEALIGSMAADPARATAASAAATPSATPPRASRPIMPTAKPSRRWIWPSATLVVAAAIGIAWMAPWQESPSARIAESVKVEPAKQEPMVVPETPKPRTIASIIASMPVAQQPPQTQTKPAPSTSPEWNHSPERPPTSPLPRTPTPRCRGQVVTTWCSTRYVER